MIFSIAWEVAIKNNVHAFSHAINMFHVRVQYWRKGVSNLPWQFVNQDTTINKLSSTFAANVRNDIMNGILLSNVVT